MILRVVHREWVGVILVELRSPFELPEWVDRVEQDAHLEVLGDLPGLGHVIVSGRIDRFVD
jgi:hypothetical protein